MEIELKEGFRKLKRGYGTMPPSKFLNRDRKEIIIPDLQEKLIYKNHEAVGFGQIYSGYIFFAGEPELYGKEIKRLRVTCVDALGKKHQFSSPPQFNLNLVAEMAGMVVPE